MILPKLIIYPGSREYPALHGRELLRLIEKTVKSKKVVSAGSLFKWELASCSRLSLDDDASDSLILKCKNQFNITLMKARAVSYIPRVEISLLQPYNVSKKIPDIIHTSLLILFNLVDSLLQSCGVLIGNVRIDTNGSHPSYIEKTVLQMAPSADIFFDPWTRGNDFINLLSYGDSARRFREKWSRVYNHGCQDIVIGKEIYPECLWSPEDLWLKSLGVVKIKPSISCCGLIFLPRKNRKPTHMTLEKNFGLLISFIMNLLEQLNCIVGFNISLR